MSIGLLPVEWAAAAPVAAAFTLRSGGVSAAPWATLNLGSHVGDAADAVQENRRRVVAALRLPAPPHWLQQVHGTTVLDADAVADAAAAATPADAVVSRSPGRVLAILVADCMPVLLAALDGSVIGAAHAGWRGLAAGVLEATIDAMRVPGAQLCAWLGPAIGARHFEVGSEVREQFLAADAGAVAAFSANERGRWQCDLAWLARRRLQRAGLTRIAGAGLCTYAEAARCYSYRRDGRTGRMAALLWLHATVS
jgi:YfiH family protein